MTEKVREALEAIIRMDDDARAARGKAGANLNGVGLVDLFDLIGHPFGVGAHRQQPCRSNQLDVALADARAALADMSQQQDGWQPIETAPRDGTRILARGGALDDIEIVSYSPDVGAWATPHFTLDDRDDEPDGYNRPRFWQPLPVIPPLKRSPT